MNKNCALILFIVFSSTYFASAEAYVSNRTQSDAIVHWSNNISLVDIFVNPANTQAYSTALVHTQVAAAIAEWNGKSRMSVRKNTTAGTNQQSLNELFFSTDPTIFNGSGVVGITQAFFKEDTGEILEADILINDTFTYSADINDPKYLGNVITHEMGHFLGLGHSQVQGSTMFYSLSRGQNQISDDDKAGIYSVYPNGNSSKGILSGKIIGGKAIVGVFGAHVQAISLKTGRVAGAAISELDGSFTINGLDKGDQFYIYTSPTAQQVGLPGRYSNARYDFCDSSKKYRGSFFQACSSAFEGYPQAVKLNSSQVNVGNITIRCGLDVPATYMQNKNTTPAAFDIQSGVASGIGNSFSGFFSPLEISNGSKDYFRMNYSNIDWNSVSASGDLYVELKVLNQAFFSPFKALIGVNRVSSSTIVTPKYIRESDGWLNLETITRIPIIRSDSSDNNFEISVTPVSVENPSAGLPYSKADYFPSYGNFEDSLLFYLVSASIVSDNGDGTYSQVISKNDQLSDNTQCPDAVNTYALTNFSVKRSVANTSRKKDALACGTVDLSGGPGSGPGGFFIGLILSLLICSLTSSIIRIMGKTWVAR